MPRSGRERTEEILWRRALLPPDLVYDPAYAMNSELWDRWFELEHNHRRRLAFAATLPENYADQEVEAEEAEEEDFDWSSTDGGADHPVKMEDQEEDDDELKKAIEASELEELGRWPELAAALRASAEDAAANRRHGEGQAYVPPPAWPQAPVAPATPPPAAPSAWLYAPPPYIILEYDEDE